MLHRQPTYEEMFAALEASRLPPDEDFERMIRRGIIDRQGRVTRLFGTAGVEPEPEALEYLAQQKAKKNGSAHTELTSDD